MIVDGRGLELRATMSHAPEEDAEEEEGQCGEPEEGAQGLWGGDGGEVGIGSAQVGARQGGEGGIGGGPQLILGRIGGLVVSDGEFARIEIPQTKRCGAFVGRGGIDGEVQLEAAEAGLFHGHGLRGGISFRQLAGPAGGSGGFRFGVAVLTQGDVPFS